MSTTVTNLLGVNVKLFVGDILENVIKKANDLFLAETEGFDEVKVQGCPCIQQINFYNLLGLTNNSN
jgi:hypothetical protein